MIAAAENDGTLPAGCRRLQIRPPGFRVSFVMPAARAALAARELVESDGGGFGDVELADRAVRRQPHQQVAMLARQAAQAGAFGAERDGDLAAEIGGGDGLLGLGG